MPIFRDFFEIYFSNIFRTKFDIVKILENTQEPKCHHRYNDFWHQKFFFQIYFPPLGIDKKSTKFPKKSNHMNIEITVNYADYDSTDQNWTSVYRLVKNIFVRNFCS